MDMITNVEFPILGENKDDLNNNKIGGISVIYLQEDLGIKYSLFKFTYLNLLNEKKLVTYTIPKHITTVDDLLNVIYFIMEMNKDCNATETERLSLNLNSNCWEDFDDIIITSFKAKLSMITCSSFKDRFNRMLDNLGY